MVEKVGEKEKEVNKIQQQKGKEIKGDICGHGSFSGREEKREKEKKKWRQRYEFKDERRNENEKNMHIRRK